MSVLNSSTSFFETSGGVIGKPGEDGKDGKSAYEIAVEHGFNGSEADWLDSLVGPPGVDGKSAYEIAKENGFTGTEQEWLDSLVGSYKPTDSAIYKFGHGLTTTTAADKTVTVSVNTASDFNGDNTRPIEAAAVQTLVGDIEALLKTV